MRRRVGLLAFCGFVATSGVANADPTAAAGTLPPWANTFPHLELEFPLLKRLDFSFASTSVPGYEPLRLPTFTASATLWTSGRLELFAFSRVAPALELDCSTLCQPVLEQTMGATTRLSLGALGPSVPATFMYVSAERVQSVPWARGSSARPRAGTRIHAGFAGLLDF
jgi:hypothetical protein